MQKNQLLLMYIELQFMVSLSNRNLMGKYCKLDIFHIMIRLIHILLCLIYVIIIILVPGIILFDMTKIIDFFAGCV